MPTGHEAGNYADATNSAQAVNVDWPPGNHVAILVNDTAGTEANRPSRFLEDPNADPRICSSTPRRSVSSVPHKQVGV